MISDMAVAGSVNYIQLIFDVVAIATGIITVFFLLQLNSKVGGKLNSALWFFIWGMVANISAIIWSIFFGHVYVLVGMEFDLHHFLMTVGMIFFIISTSRFFSIVKNG